MSTTPRSPFQHNDIVEFMLGDKIVLGRLMYSLGEGEWRVQYITESGRSFSANIWEQDVRLFDRLDFNPGVAVAFVIYEALHSGKDWS